jgi:hypothetical protein
MSRIAEVIKNKNRLDKMQKEHRKNEIYLLRSKQEFKSRLYLQIEEIEKLLDKQDVRGVVINVKDKDLANFNEAIFSSEMNSFIVEQVKSESNKFIVRRKYIDI